MIERQSDSRLSSVEETFDRAEPSGTKRRADWRSSISSKGEVVKAKEQISFPRQIEIIAESSKEHRDAMTRMMIADTKRKALEYQVEVRRDIPKNTQVRQMFKRILYHIDKKDFYRALRTVKAIERERLKRQLARLSRDFEH